MDRIAGEVGASSTQIDQAKGLLIERHELTPDQAFQLLARASMNANRKVHDIADQLVRTGELLGASPRGASGRHSPGTRRGRPAPGAPEHS